MPREDDAIVELKKKKKSKKEKGEYMRKISRLAGRSALSPENFPSEDSAADHKMKRADVGSAVMPDDGQGPEVKEKRKREKKKVIEEPVAPQDAIPGE